MAAASDAPANGVFGWAARARGWLMGLKALPAGGVAFGLGLLGALAQPPFHVWPVLVVSLTAMVWVLDGAAGARGKLRAGLWRGWCFGAGYFLAAFWWVANAFIMRGPEFAPFGPVGVLALGLGLALFWAAAGGAVAVFAPAGWRRVFFFAAAFSLAEYARGHLFGGLPWSLAGYVWPAGSAIAQSAALIGAYGLSMLTWFAFAAPAALGGPEARLGPRLIPVFTALSVFALIVTGGVGRLASARHDAAPGVALRVIQSQIDQREKWAPDNRDDIVRRYLRLTTQAGLETRTHVIWPESALPLFFLEEPRTLDAVARALGPDRVLMTGLVRRDAANPVDQRYYNSFVVLPVENGRPDLAGQEVYDKRRLVPFAEFTPLSGLIESALGGIGLSTLTNLGGGYTPGPGAASLTVPGAGRVAPQVCYEVVFPGFTPRGAERPDWIVNVSNDAWFGAYVGPLQSLAQARFRAVEEGLPVVRATSGGVSAVVDPYGRVTARAAVGEEAVVDADLPAPLAPTMYALVGDAGAIILLLAGFGVAFAPLSRTGGARARV